MDTNDRQLIDGLFDRLRQVDGQAAPRDAEAETLIRQQIGSNPAAPYYMAQAILVQEQALAAAQQRIQELERQAVEQPAGGGGFLGSLFGAGSRSSAPAPRPASRMPATAGPGMGRPGGPWGGGGGGGGFMAGAMQTAMGVAGGVLVANAIGSMFAADPAAAATPPAEEPAAEPDAAYEEADAGGGFGDEEW